MIRRLTYPGHIPALNRSQSSKVAVPFASSTWQNERRRCTQFRIGDRQSANTPSITVNKRAMSASESGHARGCSWRNRVDVN